MSNTNTKETKEVTQTVPVTVGEKQAAVVVHEDTMSIVGKIFACQNDIENESKFVRMFMHDSVVAGAKAFTQRIIATWENAVTKYSRLHPTLTREDAEKDLLASKKARELKALHDIAIGLRKEL